MARVLTSSRQQLLQPRDCVGTTARDKTIFITVSDIVRLFYDVYSLTWQADRLKREVITTDSCTLSQLADVFFFYTFLHSEGFAIAEANGEFLVQQLSHFIVS